MNPPSLPKTGWGPVHPHGGLMVTETGPREGRKEEVRGGKRDTPEWRDKVLRWPERGERKGGAGGSFWNQTQGDKEEAEGEEEEEREWMRQREEVRLGMREEAGLRQPGMQLWDAGAGEGSRG